MVFICKRTEATMGSEITNICSFTKYLLESSQVFFDGSRILPLLELICRKNGRKFVKKNLFWREDCESLLYFFSYNEKACGFDDKICRIYKITDQGRLCEFSGGSTWNWGNSLTPEYYFVWETLRDNMA